MSTTTLFKKMSEIGIKMQNAETGLAFKTLKYFRVSVPASFTGYDLVEWLSRTLKIDDNAEVVHLANQLCLYGYLFPVFEQANSIRDNNTLYRSQIPYFWPSVNSTADDVEYAIYLSKRLLRNEEKHGLAEYEADAYNRIRELLGHMWDFIQTQAEMQLKLFKEKKKVDKVVFDSQERAYWRLHRPPPGQCSCFEERYGKLEKRIRKRTSKEYHQETERLKFALKTKPWLKSPKAVETLVAWCEQFMDYDPFLSPLKDPGNPWTTDDQTLWVLNTDNVEVPTERRVRRWGFTVQELIRDTLGRQVLETFLESEFSQENIRFWLAVQDIKYSPKREVPEKVNAIYNEFLVSGAPCQVNVDSRTLEAVNKAMADKTLPPRYCFSAAEEHIFILMSKDSYPRFVRSEIYKGVLNAAQQQGSKKVNWKAIFGNVPSKKTSGLTGSVVKNSPQPGIKTSREEATSGAATNTTTPRQLSADTWVPGKRLNRSIDSTEGMQPPKTSTSSVSIAAMSDDDKKTASQVDLANVDVSVPSESSKHSAPYQEIKMHCLEICVPRYGECTDGQSITVAESFSFNESTCLPSSLGLTVCRECGRCKMSYGYSCITAFCFSDYTPTNETSRCRQGYTKCCTLPFTEYTKCIEQQCARLIGYTSYKSFIKL